MFSGGYHRSFYGFIFFDDDPFLSDDDLCHVALNEGRLFKEAHTRCGLCGEHNIEHGTILLNVQQTSAEVMFIISGRV